MHRDDALGQDGASVVVLVTEMNCCTCTACPLYVDNEAECVPLKEQAAADRGFWDGLSKQKLGQAPGEMAAYQSRRKSDKRHWQLIPFCSLAEMH